MPEAVHQCAVSDRAPVGIVRGLVLAARPQQWVKNLLVVAAPVAAGVVPVRLAVVVGVAALLAACALPLALGALKLDAIVAAYVVLSAAYDLGLKHERVIDMAIVSAGFLLRASAGGAAADLPLSRWFLIVASFGSLAVTQRRAPRPAPASHAGDDAALRGDRATHRQVVDKAFAGGDIDVVLLTFGVLGDQADAESDPDSAVHVLQVNVVGAVSVGLHAADALRRQGHGVLVVMSSVAGVRARRANFVYGSCDAGVDAFAQGLDAGLAGTGARVLIVRPGFVARR